MKKLNKQSKVKFRSKLILTLLVLLGVSVFAARTYAWPPGVPPPVNPQSTVVGLTGTIPSPPPQTGATIATPSNGQVFSALPITVRGICQSGLLIKLFNNNVFTGAAECSGGSYSITAALFNGANSLIVNDYDALDQQGPSSNTVNITFNNPNQGAQPTVVLTSSYAKLGVASGSTLSWPVVISGGKAPYALSIDWGDGTTPSLISQPNAGVFYISHSYVVAGVYTILIKATDANGDVTYLQLVGLANGASSQTAGSSRLNSSPTSPSSKGISLTTTTIIFIMLLLIIVPLSTFWLGSRHRLVNIKKRFESGEGLT